MRSEKLFTARSLEAWGGQVALVLSGVLTLVALLLLTGCASPAVRQQRFVAKPNMIFPPSRPADSTTVSSYREACLRDLLMPSFYHCSRSSAVAK